MTEKAKVQRGRPKAASPKVSTTIRLSPDVLDHFKAGGPGWQGRIDEALREAAGLRKPKAGSKSAQRARRAVIALPIGGTPLYVAAMTTSMRFGSPLAIPASMLGAMSPACVTRWAATPIEAASET